MPFQPFRSNAPGSPSGVTPGGHTASGVMGRGWGGWQQGFAGGWEAVPHATTNRRWLPASGMGSGDAELSLAGGSPVGEPQVANEGSEAEESDEVRRKRTEAVLFLHRGPVNLRKLASLAGLADATEARTRIRELNRIYEETASALRVEEIGGGHQIFTRPSLAPWLRRLRHLPPSLQLGAAVMETLAIIAYRQPVLRADVEAIRGVACGELIRQLMQRDLVRISGRSEELGRPYLYGTTPRFLQLFGLKNVTSLPPLPGASIRENSGDTLANSEDQLQATQASAPIELPIALNLPLSESLPSVPTTLKESDVNVAPGPVVIDEIRETLESDSAVAVLAPPTRSLPPASVDDDEDELWEDDDDAEDDEDDDWEDDEDEDDDLDDEDEWEEVGDDDDEDDVADDEEDGEDDVEEVETDEDEVDDELEDDDWDDDEDDDWDDDEEDADEEDEEWD